MFQCTAVFAEEAIDITSEITFECKNINLTKIIDNSISTHCKSENIQITGRTDVPLEGIYVKYNKTPGGGFINIDTPVAQNGFLHEYINLYGEKEFTLFYPEADICDIQVYSQGVLPKSVQKWEIGEVETDILLCATHSDDDQLFFAGLLPYYAGYRKVNVRVAYFINHYDTYNRTHELLDGLWHCGVKNYPDISPFPDGYSDSAEGAEKNLNTKGFAYKDFVNFQKNLIQKYRPLVAVLHDFEGEYGHGAHMLNTKTFIEAVQALKNEIDYIPEKIYIHLLEENKIEIDIDTSLDVFDGKTPFNVSQEAFRFHKSQHWTWFYDWIYGNDGNRTSASQIRSYNPKQYGLYYSSVGEDIHKNDMLENIHTYAERKRRAKELEMLKESALFKLAEKTKSFNEMSFTDIQYTNTESIRNIIKSITVVVIIIIVIFLVVVFAKHKKNKR